MTWPSVLINMHIGSLSMSHLLQPTVPAKISFHFQTKTTFAFKARQPYRVTNHTDTAQLTNKKGTLHTTECFYFPFTNVPNNDWTLDQASNATEHAAGMETFMTSNRNSYAALYLF